MSMLLKLSYATPLKRIRTSNQSAVLSIFGTDDGTYYLYISASSGSQWASFTVTRPYPDFLRIQVPASNGQNFKEEDTLALSVKWGMNSRSYYYGNYVNTLITGPSGDTNYETFGMAYASSFYGTSNMTGYIFYGMAGRPSHPGMTD